MTLLRISRHSGELKPASIRRRREEIGRAGIIFLNFQLRVWKTLPDLTARRRWDFSAKLQVKGTRTSKRSIRVKLSYWKRAIEDVLPWFFFVVRLEREVPREVAFLHIGPELIESVLHRIRLSS